jgi:hypothetical protein
VQEPTTSPAQATNATSREQYSIGTWGSPNNNLTFVEEISASEYEELRQALTAIGRLEAPFHYKLVERNFQDLATVNQFVTIVISLGREFAEADHKQLAESLMTTTVNWLTSMRLYLDHEETDLKRRFGKPSAEVDRFKAATAFAFDGKLGYRFAYKFRNYVQHCGLPLSEIKVGRVVDARTKARQSVRFLLKRDDLLASFSEWGSVKKDLEVLSPEFELLPLVEEAMTGLRSIHRVCAEIELEQALQHARSLVNALDRIEATAAKGQPALFRCTGDPRVSLQITPQLLQAGAVRNLQSVLEGKIDSESLWATPENPPPLPLDPTTIRERFHRDNRGVQVITAWLSEGGGTPNFLRVVNDLMREDGSYEPVLTGLVNISALLAHMAATALGVSAKGLIAGLLDIYGQFDQPNSEGPGGP